jgi:hypothetical protein
MPDLEQEKKEIEEGLLSVLAGKDKGLTMIAALSIAVTTAFQIGADKDTVQALFDRIWQRRHTQ